MSGKQAKRRRAVELEVETAKTTPVVVRLIRSSIDRLRHEYARRLRILRERDPEQTAELADAITPCDTCAFRRTADFTDGDIGFLRTSTLLIDALDRGAPFMCHLPKEDDAEDHKPAALPCIGWLALQSPIPGAFSVRELLGDDLVDLMVDGSKALNPERHKAQ